MPITMMSFGVLTRAGKRVLTDAILDCANWNYFEEDLIQEGAYQSNQAVLTTAINDKGGARKAYERVEINRQNIGEQNV